MKKINLQGTWNFCFDQEKVGIHQQFFRKTFDDQINLPATVSTAQKGKPSEEKNTGYLTDPFWYEGYTWYSKMVEFSDTKGKEFFLVLERTRVSHVWINDTYLGSNQSLCTSHRYCLTPYVKNHNQLTIMIDNTSYPVPGGHMTSKDTQTNWNGITGELYIEERSTSYLTGIQIYPDVKNRQIEVKMTLNGANTGRLTAFVTGDAAALPKKEYSLQGGENSFVYGLDETVQTWSEYTPALYQLNLVLQQDNELALNEYQVSFGLREFIATEKYFEINGMRTFLRGKHDGLIFPITGHAPTDVQSWLLVLGTAKEYGINHYRFHTCCPPEAAFEAADRLGIYMEPELPFWGTVTELGEENHDEQGQQYLIQEGYRILDEFGNHPSFVMMSLGNELWGSRSVLNQILGGYKQYDNRHLYTQGSNNFQFVPCILDNEDFYSGVRFSVDRLFRGSYAMCDAPQGHIQTMAPNTVYNYDPMIRPTNLLGEMVEDGEVTIQYGTGTKTVKVDASQEVMPHIPVVSHEIGQYAMYPDFSETVKYTGVLKAKNLEVLKERAQAKGIFSMADSFFLASGRFAADCYKAEIEAALKSNELAGIQILDLQDFTGQGTALVGILNSFMENKGVIAKEEWQQFCSEAVLLAELPQFTYTAGEKVKIKVKFAAFQLTPIVNPKLKLSIQDNENTYLTENKDISGEYVNGLYQLTEFDITIPAIDNAKQLKIEVSVTGSKIKNSYDIWVYPETLPTVAEENVAVTVSFSDAINHLQQGKNVLWYPENLNETNSIEGTYCTDFWCYPMFRSISESVGKPVPIGTHGFYIDPKHPVFDSFPTETYSTPQWYDFVSNSRALILDDSPIEPVVWTIDNFERNHKLGNLMEVKVGQGNLMICTSNLRKLTESAPAKQLEYSILNYMSSPKFDPKTKITVEELKDVIKCK